MIPREKSSVTLQVMKKKPKGNKGRVANKPPQTKVEKVQSFFRWAADDVLTKWAAKQLPVWCLRAAPVCGFGCLRA